jgi:endonuclease G
MPLSSAVAACLAVFMLMLSVPSLAQAAACDPLFVAGQAPALHNAKLAQRTTALCNTAYAALASGVTRGPLWSAEHLTAASLAGARNTPRHGVFHEDERLSPDDRAMLSDYARSGYDRGHMTPSGDMPGTQAQQQSFSLVNIVPQTPQLNRGPWEGIESAVRRLAEDRGELYVVTGPAFQGGQLQVLKGRVLVPTSTWKAIYDPSLPGAGAYMCTNVSRPTCTHLSIAALERETGIDPFPAASIAIKQMQMPLPPPEPSRYRRSGQKHPPAHHGLFAPLFQ